MNKEELNLIRSRCRFMDKEDIYKWILSDEIKILNLKQALNEIREYIDNHKRNLIHPITHEEYEVLDDENIINILQIIDKAGDKK